MLQGNIKKYKIIVVIGDFILLNLSYLLSFLTIAGAHQFDSFDFSLIYIINFSWLLFVFEKSMYKITNVTTLIHVFSSFFRTLFFHAIFTFVSVSVLYKFGFDKTILFINYLYFIFLFILWRTIFVYSIKRLYKFGVKYRNTVIIGLNPNSFQLMRHLKSSFYLGYNFLGFFDDNYVPIKNKNLFLGKICMLEKYCKENKVDDIFYTLSLDNKENISAIMKLCDQNFMRLKLVPDFSGFLNKKVEIKFYNKIPILTLHKEPLENPVNRIIKRFFDIIFSSLVILIVFPLIFPIIALIIKLTSRGPVFYKQKRAGRNYKVFIIWKFRSMTLGNNKEYIQAKKEDARVTKIGKFIRKTSIDELPQFLNVLMGDMSVVGPRPHPLKLDEEYKMLVDQYMIRNWVKPGITGFAQVKGFRGETESKWKMHKRVQYDIWYIENYTFFLDMYIIVNTILNIFKGEKNAY
ncbi:MAG: undecaprenyl-phosphate glucose phosphotransferase [Bacteroidetes bacterium GWF2_29_10]|nr:MAG: undecaprenyl-phosphate glucose phosphotransferase [Bacteroidetes bacterium GWF2_29_10]